MTSKTPALKSRVAAVAAGAAAVAGLIFFLGGPDHDRVPSAQSPADALADEKAADGSVDADDADTSPPAPKCPVADARAALVDRLGGANPFRSDDISAVVSPRGSVFVVAQQDSGILLGRLAVGGDIVWARQFCDARSAVLAVDKQGNALLLRDDPLDGHDSANGSSSVLSLVADDGHDLWSYGVEAAELLAVDPRGAIVTSHQTSTTHSTTMLWRDAAGVVTRSKEIQGVRVHSIAVDENGNIGFGGDFRGAVDIAGQRFNSSSDGLDIVAGRLDSSGGIPWAVHLGPTGYLGTRVAFDASGNLVILSTPRDPDDDLLPNLLLVKLESGGHTLFQRRFRHHVVGLDLYVGDQGETIVTGNLGGAVNFGTTVVRGWGARFLARVDNGGTPEGAVTDLPGGCVIARDQSKRLARFPLDGGASAAWSTHELCVPWGGLSSAESVPDAAAEAPVQKRQRSAFARYPLAAIDGGSDWSIETWMDSRITGTNHHDESCFGWDLATEGIEGWDSPPLEATVRLVDAQGTVIDELTSGASMITLDALRLQGDDRVTWQMVRKPRVCRSVWEMVYTNLLEVRDGHLRRVSAVDEHDGEPAVIVLKEGALVNWQLVEARSGNGRDILYADSSHSRCSKVECTPLLIRYAWESGRWVRHERRLQGERWFGEYFPDPREFP